MQQDTQPLRQKLMNAALALTWCSGLLLAGSEGPLMPYLNAFGVLLFAGATLWLGTRLAADAGKKTTAVRPWESRVSVLVSGRRPGFSHRVGRGYGLPAGAVWSGLDN